MLRISKKNLDRLRAGKPPALSESAFQAQVIHYAKLRSWRIAHFRPALDRRGRWKTAVQADGAGFPDLCIVRGNRIIWAELKSPTGVVSAEQQQWLDALRMASQDVYLWRPDDWDEIVRILE